MIDDNSVEIVDCVLDESSYVSKLFLGGKIRKLNNQNGTPITGLQDVVKYHGNPGFRRYISTSNDIDELKYLRSDLYLTLNQLEKIKERISSCKKLGDCSKTKLYYKNIKKKYIDQGLTEKDVDKAIAEFKKDITTCNTKIRQLKKTVKESSSLLENSFAQDIFNELDM